MPSLVPRFLTLTLVLLPLGMAGAGQGAQRQNVDHGQGELGAHPALGPKPGDAPRGLRVLGTEGAKRTLLYVPAGYDPAHPAPLVVFFHGAGGDAGHTLPAFSAQADEVGAILLAPSSGGITWDVILGDYGPDVASLDRALAEVFSRYAVDAERIAVAGFSDGASYALSLGVANGDLFSHIVALSPGFMAPARREGAPAVFVSHGVDDAMLPIARSSRRLVPALERSGYRVRYEEFAGGHAIPPDIARDAFGWFASAAR